jgi:hypothetical protein
MSARLVARFFAFALFVAACSSVVGCYHPHWHHW